MKMIHVITGLSEGGAENMLFKLLAKLDENIDTEVVTITNIGPVGKKIHSLSIPIHQVGMKRGIPDPRGIIRLAKLFKQKKPDLIQTWMYHADLIGGISSKITGRIPIIWNIRHSNLNKQGNKRSTILTANACAYLSNKIPCKIVCCSKASAKTHIELGYDSKRIIVISNGFDLSSYKPDLEARLSLRKELNINESTILIGMVARFDPQKDYNNFIEAASILISKSYDVKFILVGDNVNWDNKELIGLIKKKMGDNNSMFQLLGRRDDISTINNCLDIATLSSAYGEGFPNVIGEAMACGLPFVATDVGDSALIIGETGLSVPPRSSKALANAWIQLIKLGKKGRNEMGKMARERVIKNYNIYDIVKQYEQLYYEVYRTKNH